MIVRVWEQAVKAEIGAVVVACDGEQIAEAVVNAGGLAVLTHPDHPSGSDRISEALSLIDPEKKFDVVVNLQGDVPTIEPDVIEKVLGPLRNTAVDIATLAAPITLEVEMTDPSVVKPIISFYNETEGRALYFTRATAPTGGGPLYHHIGIYAYRRRALEWFVEHEPSPLEKREKLEQLRALELGMRIDISVVDTVPLGVDTEEHLLKARRYFGEAV